MPKTYNIDCDDIHDKRSFINHIRSLKGLWRFVCSKPRKYHTRYKYYFGHVVKLLEQENIFFDDRGNARDSAGIHDMLKKMFNPTLVQEENGAIVEKGGTTTTLDDNEFVRFYEPQIIAFFSQEPFYVPFTDRDEWIIEMKMKHHEKAQLITELNS